MAIQIGIQPVQISPPEELVDVDGEKVEFAPPPWLNRHFCCQVQSLVVTPATQCVKETYGTDPFLICPLIEPILNE